MTVFADGQIDGDLADGGELVATPKALEAMPACT
jgi:hypothetical protein